MLLALFFLAVGPVFAGNDVVITCASGGNCTKSSNLPLFQESNIYPGYLKSQNVTVINNRQKDCNLKFKATLKDVPASILPGKIMLSITKGVNVWYSGNLQNATAAAGNILGVIPAGATNLYLWTASFDQDAGNDYQNVNTTFDLDFNFECEDEVPTPTPTPTTTINPSSAPTSSPDNPSPPVCSDIAPASAPVLTSAVAGTNSVTLFWIEASGPLTYYLVAFGTQSGLPLYGNPNVGGPGTTSYTVSNLSAGQTYYFKVRAGNGCMPGSFSNELSAVPLGTSLAVGVPPGFQAGVLGAQEELGGQINGGISSAGGTLVEGAKTENVCPFWWIVLIAQTILLALYYWRFTKKGEKLPRKWWLVAGILVLVAYLVDNYAHTHWYIPSKMCPWEIWLGIVLAGIETIGDKVMRKV